MGDVLLTDRDGMERHVLSRITSGDYWTILAATEMGNRIAEGIEERFYRGKANADFEALLIPGVPGSIVVALYFGHKRRMTPEQLIATGAVFGGQKPGELQDVLLAPDTPMPVVRWLSEIYDRRETATTTPDARP